MKPTPQTCADVRELLLVDRKRAEQHAAGCPDCAMWLERQGRVAGVLGSMDRLVTPSELDGLVAEGLSVGNGAILGALRGLERLEAPEQLDDLLARSLVAEAETEFTADTQLEIPAWTALLSGLEPQAAPAVLDRLVDEELADASQALTRRFAGGLFRKASPRALSSRVAKDLDTPAATRTGISRYRWLPLSSAAAAALLIWMASPVLFKDAPKPTPRFRVVHVESLASMDPLARSLVEGFAGGRVLSMDRRKNNKGSEL